MTCNYFPPYGPDGADSKHIKHLSMELVKRGHEVHVMHSLDAYNMKSSWWNMEPVSKKKALPSNKFDHIIEAPTGKSDLYFTYVFGKSIFVNNCFKRLLNEINPDVIHHHNMSMLGYKLLQKQGDYLSLYTAHDYWLICQQNLMMKYRRI